MKTRQRSTFTGRQKIFNAILYYLIIAPIASVVGIYWFNAWIGATPAQFPVDFSIAALCLIAPLYLLRVMPAMGRTKVFARPYKGSNMYKQIFLVALFPATIFLAADQLVYPVGKHLLLNYFGTTTNAVSIDAYYLGKRVIVGSQWYLGAVDYYRVDDPTTADSVDDYIVVYLDENTGQTTKISYKPAKTKAMQVERLNNALEKRATVRYVRFAPFISTSKNHP